MSTPLPVRTGRLGWTFYFYISSNLPPNRHYNKPALIYQSQLNRLKNRGLSVINEPKALHLLEQISYYRLSGYWYPMLSSPKNQHQFKPNSTFENAFKLYCFDRELRSLITSQLEKIEISVRAKMIYLMWHRHGPYWFSSINLFNNQQKFNATIGKLRNEYSRSDEEFIKSFRRKYTNPLPPCCMILEISSFGNLSNIYSNLKPGLDKRAIANFYGLSDTAFASWLHSLTYVRNICAHHSRLWNKRMSIRPLAPRRPRDKFLTNTTLPNPNPNRGSILNNNSTYYLMSMIIYLLKTINPENTFKEKFYQLLKKYKSVDVKAMGFPSDWKTEELWNWDKVITDSKWYNKLLKILKSKLASR